MLASASVAVYMRVDQLLLRQLSDETQLGLYSAILPLSQPLPARVAWTRRMRVRHELGSA